MKKYILFTIVLFASINIYPQSLSWIKMGMTESEIRNNLNHNGIWTRSESDGLVDVYTYYYIQESTNVYQFFIDKHKGCVYYKIAIKKSITNERSLINNLTDLYGPPKFTRGQYLWSIGNDNILPVDIVGITLLAQESRSIIRQFKSEVRIFAVKRPR